MSIDELTHVNVGLPKIHGNSKQLASINDDYEEEYEDRVPSKPHGVANVDGEEVINAKLLERGSRGRSRDQVEVISKSGSVGPAEHRSRQRG